MNIIIVFRNGQEIIKALNVSNANEQLKNIYNKIIEGKAFFLEGSIYQGWDIVNARIQNKYQ
jgi:hypothetical protein